MRSAHLWRGGTDHTAMADTRNNIHSLTQPDQGQRGRTRNQKTLRRPPPRRLVALTNAFAKIDGICVGRRSWRRTCTWRRSGCRRHGECRRWRRSAWGSSGRWPAGRGGGRRIAEELERTRPATVRPEREQPSLNAVGGSAAGNDTNAPGIPGARTTGSNIGGYGNDSTGGVPVGVPASASPGGTSPEALSSQRSATDDPTAAKDVQGVAEAGSFSPTGPDQGQGPDGVSTVIVAARPCGVAAHETDGTTTCIGISGWHGS